MKCLVSCEEATHCNDPCPMHHIFCLLEFWHQKTQLENAAPDICILSCRVKYGSTQNTYFVITGGHILLVPFLYYCLLILFLFFHSKRSLL